MEIEILGTVYTIYETDHIDTGIDGECNFYSKTIRIRSVNSLLDDGTPEEKRERHRQVIRHEIIHATLYESGLNEYAHDETLVDWIALQFDKINKIVEQAGG